MGARISFFWEKGEASKYYYAIGINGSPIFSNGIGLSMNNGRFKKIKRETAVFVSKFMERRIE